MNLPFELEELKNKPQWVCHKNKIPKNPNTGGNAKSNDASTWSDYETVITATDRWNFDGIGFEFGNFPENTLRVSGIDLDHVIRADGTLEPFAAEVVELLNSYTEFSFSGTGLHILCYAKTKNVGSRVNLHNNCGLEMYNHDRYFILTGKVFGSPKPLCERTDEFNSLYEKYFSQRTSQQNNDTSLKKSQLSVSSPCETDGELLEKMFSSRKGAEIRALFEGDTSRHSGDDSRADLALCSHLAYWTGKDPYRMDNLFRQSGLMRSKWDERRGEQTYGQRTISVALSNVDSVYSPVPNLSELRGQEKLSENSTKSELDKRTLIESSDEIDIDLLISQNVHSYINSTGGDWGVRNDLERFRKFANRKTGFSNIDEKVSLYPGLYVLGAITSLGKTTFIHQMADQLCKAGEHVLFFSLEQTRLELVTKGVSRLTAQSNLPTAVSSIDIRNGKFDADERKAVIDKAFSDYAKFTEHELIIECSFDMGVNTVIDIVEKYIEKTKIIPIVVVDYLQIVYPLDARQSTKDAVDMNVKAFKKLQKDHDLVVFLVSSLNRANYLTPIDFEAFKESGGIEYTADVIWGLQLNVMNDEIFDKDKNLKSKREKVREAKKEKPRRIEFVCLKNRYGESSYSCYFDYYAQYDYFVPAEFSDFADYDERL